MSGGQYRSPKTLLGFLGVVVLIMSSFTFAVTLVLADNESLRWLVGPLLLVFFIGVVVLVVVVIRLAQRDPTPLVLGEMSGEDWIAHRRLVVGDSDLGERVELPQTAAASAPQPDEVEDDQTVPAELEPGDS